MENMFEPILDKDEKIVKIFKPKKCVFFVKNLIPMVFLFLFVELFIIGVGLSEVELAESSFDMKGFWIVFAVSMVVWLLVLGLTILLMNVYYKNVYYAYTNKRVVIRKGIIGVDYKSLDIKMIGASNVNVSLMDKILRKNTGTISFGSMASPMVTTNGVVNHFVFAHLENPYEIYKEIKNYISDSTDKEVKKAPAKAKTVTKTLK